MRYYGYWHSPNTPVRLKKYDEQFSGIVWWSKALIIALDVIAYNMCD